MLLSFFICWKCVLLVLFHQACYDFSDVCRCLLILCFIHEMFCIQSKNAFYYFRFINLHWCKTICHVQNAQYTSCILELLIFLIYIFLLLYKKIKKIKKSYTEHSIRNWLMLIKKKIDLWFEVFPMIIMRGPCVPYLSYVIELNP